MIRSLYNWTMKWSAHPHAPLALFLIALAEASFFPIPPDLLLIPMVLAAHERGLKLAAICTAGSVIGGAAGYLIGAVGWEVLGQPIVAHLGLLDKYDIAVGWFGEYGILVVAVAAFTPIPYKLFTIAAGALGLPFLPFMVTSLLGRGARFFLVAGVLMWGGQWLRDQVERHLERLTLALGVLLVLGFMALKWAH